MTFRSLTLHLAGRLLVFKDCADSYNRPHYWKVELNEFLCPTEYFIYTLVGGTKAASDILAHILQCQCWSNVDLYSFKPSKR